MAILLNLVKSCILPRSFTITIIDGASAADRIAIKTVDGGHVSYTWTSNQVKQFF